MALPILLTSGLSLKIKEKPLQAYNVFEEDNLWNDCFNKNGVNANLI